MPIAVDAHAVVRSSARIHQLPPSPSSHHRPPHRCPLMPSTRPVFDTSNPAPVRGSCPWPMKRARASPVSPTGPCAVHRFVSRPTGASPPTRLPPWPARRQSYQRYGTPHFDEADLLPESRAVRRRELSPCPMLRETDSVRHVCLDALASGAPPPDSPDVDVQANIRELEAVLAGDHYIPATRAWDATAAPAVSMENGAATAHAGGGHIADAACEEEEDDDKISTCSEATNHTSVSSCEV
jgi:hypothetical protein